MNMEARFAAVVARRADAGLIAADGTACATAAQKAHHDLRHALKQRDDWGNLPKHLEAQLIATRNAAKGGAA